MKRFLMLILFLSIAAFGQDDSYCEEALFVQNNDLSLAKVDIASENKAFFYKDLESCISSNDYSCKTKAYLLDGDEVVVSHRFIGYISDQNMDFSCVWFSGEYGTTVAWLESSVLEPMQSVTWPEDWLGHWQYNDNDIYLNKSHFSDDLILEALAIWKNANNSIHFGELFKRLPAAENGKLLYEDEYDCRLELSLLGDYLLASDNKQCGGANVSFDGIYKKNR